ncbi:MAG: hypothetical protein ACO294_11480, partial [Methylococcales bacterium]
MNDRIKDLALDAIVENIASEAWVFTDSELEKFAKSIIQECIDVVDKVYDEQTGMGAKLSRRQTPYQEIIDGIEE